MILSVGALQLVVLHCRIHVALLVATKLKPVAVVKRQSVRLPRLSLVLNSRKTAPVLSGKQVCDVFLLCVSIRDAVPSFSASRNIQYV